MKHFSANIRTVSKSIWILVACLIMSIASKAVSHDYHPATEFRGYETIDDIRLYYEVHGEGEPLLLLHGGMVSGAESWSRVLPLLPKGFKIIIPDSREHGRSTGSDKAISYALLTENIVELMDKLEIDKAHIVGWSDGGILGLDMAMRFPDRIDKLVIYGTNYHFDGVPKNIRKQIGTMTAENRPKWITDITYLNIAPDPSKMGMMVKKVVHMWLTEPTWEKDDLANIDTPVLILEDEIGKAIVPEHTKIMANSIKGAELILIPETDHLAPQTKAEEFTKLVSGFLVD